MLQQKKITFLIALSLVVIDQLIKYTLVTGGIFVWGPFRWLSIRVTENRGIAFSIPFPRALLIILSAAIIGLALWWFKKHTHTLGAALGFGLFVGGALSNLLDRIFHGAVTDYLNIATGSFNLADFAIIAGLLLLIFSPSQPKQKD